jgi:hypothetical protein
MRWERTFDFAAPLEAARGVEHDDSGSEIAGLRIDEASCELAWTEDERGDHVHQAVALLSGIELRSAGEIGGAVGPLAEVA